MIVLPKSGRRFPTPEQAAHITAREQPRRVRKSTTLSANFLRQNVLMPRLIPPPNAGTAAAAPVDVNGQIGVNVRDATLQGTTMIATQSGNALAPLRVEQTGVGYDDRWLS